MHLLVKPPLVLNIGFCPHIWTRWTAVTKFRPCDDSEALAELIVLRVPQLFQPDCIRISVDIGDLVFHAASMKFVPELKYDGLFGCLKGWDNPQVASSELERDRYCVLIFSWADAQERERFKDPSVIDANPRDPRYYGDWYDRCVLSHQALESNGTHADRFDLHIEIAEDSKGTQ